MFGPGQKRPFKKDRYGAYREVNLGQGVHAHEGHCNRGGSRPGLLTGFDLGDEILDWAGQVYVLQVPHILMPRGCTAIQEARGVKIPAVQFNKVHLTRCT